MIDEKSIQRALQAKKLYSGAIDGILGKRSLAGMRTAVMRANGVPSAAEWPIPRLRIAFSQIMFKDLGFYSGTIDGLRGPNTEYALERWQNHLRDVDEAPVGVSIKESDVPQQRDALAYYGKPGTNLIRMELPYPMRLAWDLGTTIRSFQFNKRAAPSAQKVLRRALDYYGEQRIRELHLDRFAGGFVNRPMRGGSRTSMHAFAAIDFDSENNQLRWGRDRAWLARPVYDPWWGFWEEEGWVSLGRERNFDWMHVQRARL